MGHDATVDGIARGLEERNDRAMPGTDRHRIGQWVLKADRGATGRANSVWPAGSPGLAMSTAVDLAEEWYRSRGLTPQFMMHDGTDADLEPELDRRGYRSGGFTQVMVGGLDAIVDIFGPAADPEGRQITVDSRPTDDWAQLIGDDDRLAEITATDLPQRFVSVIDDAGRLLGGGMATIDRPWCGLFAMRTAPEARRRGVASAVLWRLARAGLSLGARGAWLQVEQENTGAIALYERAAFGVAHRYHYRAAPDVTEPGR